VLVRAINRSIRALLWLLAAIFLLFTLGAVNTVRLGIEKLHASVTLPNGMIVKREYQPGDGIVMVIANADGGTLVARIVAICFDARFAEVRTEEGASPHKRFIDPLYDPEYTTIWPEIAARRSGLRDAAGQCTGFSSDRIEEDLLGGGNTIFSIERLP
jgi:hypothetical protein